MTWQKPGSTPGQPSDEQVQTRAAFDNGGAAPGGGPPGSEVQFGEGGANGERGIGSFLVGAAAGGLGHKIFAGNSHSSGGYSSNNSGGGMGFGGTMLAGGIGAGGALLLSHLISKRKNSRPPNGPPPFFGGGGQSYSQTSSFSKW